GGITGLRIFLAAFQANCGKIPIDFWVPEARLPRLGFHNQPNSFVSRSSSKRWMAGEQLIKDCAEAVHIRRPCKLLVLTPRLFGSHVAGCSQYFHRASESALRFDQASQPEISEVRFALGIEENVTRLNVAVQDPMFVCVMSGARQLGDELRCIAE